MKEPGTMIHRSPLGIVGSVDQPADAEMRDGRRTHRAGFQRHDKRAALQTDGTTPTGRLPHGQKLGMGTGIAPLFHMIAGHAQNMPLIIQHNGTDGNLSCPCRPIRQNESLLHGLPYRHDRGRRHGRTPLKRKTDHNPLPTAL